MAAASTVLLYRISQFLTEDYNSVLQIFLVDVWEALG